MTLLYFAWVRQKIGKSEETLAAPVASVRALIAFLESRGPGYRQAFADLERIRVAVNQVHASLDHAISDTDEIAFFPPVTGG